MGREESSVEHCGAGNTRVWRSPLRIFHQITCPAGARLDLKWSSNATRMDTSGTQLGQMELDEPNGAEMEPSGAQTEFKWKPMELNWSPVELKWTSNGPQVELRGAQIELREPGGSQLEPQSSPMELNWSPVEPKRSSNGAQWSSNGAGGVSESSEMAVNNQYI